MWESRRDFQRVWEGWEAGFMAFHAFHTLSFPWPAFSPAMLDEQLCLCHPAQSAKPQRTARRDQMTPRRGALVARMARMARQHRAAESVGRRDSIES